MIIELQDVLIVKKKNFSLGIQKIQFLKCFQIVKIRAKNKGVLHTITSKDLENIWPKDNLCPVLRKYLLI